MMPHILGAQDGDWQKLIPFAVLALLWVLGAVSTAAKKMQRTASRPPQLPQAQAGSAGVQGRAAGPGGVMQVLREAQAAAAARMEWTQPPPAQPTKQPKRRGNAKKQGAAAAAPKPAQPKR